MEKSDKCTGLSQLSEKERVRNRNTEREKRREDGGLIMDTAIVTLFTHYPHLIALTARCVPSPPTSYYLLYYLSKPFPQQAADRTAESPGPNPPCAAVMQVKHMSQSLRNQKSDYSSHNIHL